MLSGFPRSPRLPQRCGDNAGGTGVRPVLLPPPVPGCAAAGDEQSHKINQHLPARCVFGKLGAFVFWLEVDLYPSQKAIAVPISHGCVFR